MSSTRVLIKVKGGCHILGDKAALWEELKFSRCDLFFVFEVEECWAVESQVWFPAGPFRGWTTLWVHRLTTSFLYSVNLGILTPVLSAHGAAGELDG